VFRIARFIGVTIDTIYNKTDKRGNKKLCILFFHRNLLRFFPHSSVKKRHSDREWWRWRASGGEGEGLEITWIKNSFKDYIVISCWFGDFVQIWTLLRKLIFFSSPFLSSSFSCIMEMIFFLFRGDIYSAEKL
jgi:hypothetical protein